MHVEELDDSVSTWEPRPERVELDEVLHAVVHELGAPVRSVLAHTDRLLNASLIPTSEDMQGRLQWLRHAGQDLDALMKAMASLAAIGQGSVQRREVDVSRLAEGVARRHIGAKEHHRIVVQPELRAQADPGLLERLFEELIDNAVKFSAPTPEPLIEVTGDGSIFTIRDNGVGFDPRYVRSLGSPFRRLHGKEFPGRGIGLCVVRRVLARHGGALSVRSRADAGCTVAFSLGHDDDR